MLRAARARGSNRFYTFARHAAATRTRMCHAARTISCFGGFIVSPHLLELSMPLYSVLRRPFPGHTNEPSPPSIWRRGSMRIWLLISAAWIMGPLDLPDHDTVPSGFRGSDLSGDSGAAVRPPVALLLFGADAGPGIQRLSRWMSDRRHDR